MSMQKKTRSLLEEFDDIIRVSQKEDIIESRANHTIKSAINILNLIGETFSPEEADELERRFINAIKGKDYSKFERGISKVKQRKNLIVLEGKKSNEG
jgi:hypothetical protein